MTTVEERAEYILQLERSIASIELTHMEKSVLRWDIAYCREFRCRCNRSGVGGSCICLDKFSHERLAYISEKAGVSWDTIIQRVLPSLQRKSELADWYNAAPFAPALDVLRMNRHKRHNFPATGQQRKRKRGGQSYSNDLKKRAVELYQVVGSSYKVAAQLNIAQKTVINWAREELVMA